MIVKADRKFDLRKFQKFNLSTETYKFKISEMYKLAALKAALKRELDEKEVNLKKCYKQKIIYKVGRPISGGTLRFVGGKGEVKIKDPSRWVTFTRTSVMYFQVQAFETVYIKKGK